MPGFEASVANILFRFQAHLEQIPAAERHFVAIGNEPRNPKRENAAIQRISKAATRLQANGLIKCLRPGSPQKRNNAVWLLLLGDAEENAEVEAYVRRRLNL